MGGASIHGRSAPRRVLLLGGGLDSACIWSLEGWPPAVFYDLDTAGCRADRQAVLRLVRLAPAGTTCRIHSLSQLGLAENERPESGYVPYRNLLLLLTASIQFPQADLIVGQVAEWNRDKNPRFYRQVERIRRDLGFDSGRVLAPYRGMTKTELVRKYLAAGGSAEYLLASHSCLRGVPACGRCSSCLNRWVAFKNNGLDTGTPAPRWADYAASVSAQRHVWRWQNARLYWRRWREAMAAFGGRNELDRS